ncbi:hypothetical protein GCM10027047_33320 [Rhodococcus aerolatus]
MAATADTVPAIEAVVDFCVPDFVSRARAARLPGEVRGERFWHGRPTVDRHPYWELTLPCTTSGTGLAGIRVQRDGRWAWVQRPGEDTVRPVTYDEITAAFEARLSG